MGHVQDRTVDISENVEQRDQDMGKGKNHTGTQESGIHLSAASENKQT